MELGLAPALRCTNRGQVEAWLAGWGMTAQVAEADVRCAPGASPRWGVLPSLQVGGTRHRTAYSMDETAAHTTLTRDCCPRWVPTGCPSCRPRSGGGC